MQAPTDFSKWMAVLMTSRIPIFLTLNIENHPFIVRKKVFAFNAPLQSLVNEAALDLFDNMNIAMNNGANGLVLAGRPVKTDQPYSNLAIMNNGLLLETTANNPLKFYQYGIAAIHFNFKDILRMGNSYFASSPALFPSPIKEAFEAGRMALSEHKAKQKEELAPIEPDWKKLLG